MSDELDPSVMEREGYRVVSGNGDPLRFKAEIAMHKLRRLDVQPWYHERGQWAMFVK